MKLNYEVGSFTNDKGQAVSYDKFFVNIFLNDIDYKLPIKIEEKFLKSQVKENIETAVIVLESTENSKKETVYKPYVSFKMGAAEMKQPVTVTVADLFILRLYNCN